MEPTKEPRIFESRVKYLFGSRSYEVPLTETRNISERINRINFILMMMMKIII